MCAYEIYKNWLENEHIDTETKLELQSIQGKPAEIEERFYKQLEFGTGGIRGILGAGRNRINQYTIRRISKGLAHYIISFGPDACKRGVVIAFDSRHQSKELATETAQTLLAHNIKAYVFEDPSPTPLLSFSLKQLNCIAGIVITASHNPPEYNGYKVYWEDGGQIVPTRAKAIANSIDAIEEIPASLLIKQNEEIIWLNSDLSDRYISQLIEMLPQTNHIQSSNLRIIYTPLHGTGGLIVEKLLTEAGFSHFSIVADQAKPDPNFSTVTLPNPEEKAAFEQALTLATSTNADIIFANDPDCDRVGAFVKHGETYVHLSGNQVGAILLHHILSAKHNGGSLPQNGVLVKTIVTSNFGRVIAQKYGVETIETLTGFKYIGEKIEEFTKTKEKSFLFGYEESCGYLTETFVRDKDGIMAILLLCELAATYKVQGKTLYDVLEDLYKEHGYFLEELESITFKGKNGMEKMCQILEAWRGDPPTRIHSFHITKMCDHRAQECTHLSTKGHSKTELPKENALHFTCADESWFCLRPSGTEPKLKIYFGVKGTSHKEANEKLQILVSEIMRSIEGVYK